MKGGMPPAKPAPKPAANLIEKTEKTDSAKAPESRGADAEKLLIPPSPLVT